MNDTATHTVRVADIATTGQDRIDGPLLLDAIRAALDEHGAVRLSFRGMTSVTPSLVNEAMVPLLEDASIETLRSQVVIVDVTRHVGETVKRCMEHGVRWNAGEFTPLNDADIARMPILEMEQDADGRYQVVGDLHAGDAIPDHLNPFIRACDMDDASIERMIDDELNRPYDPDESAMDRLMRPTLRDRGISVIQCRDESRDMFERFEKISISGLPGQGFDYRSKNQAPRSYRRR